MKTKHSTYPYQRSHLTTRHSTFKFMSRTENTSHTSLHAKKAVNMTSQRLNTDSTQSET